MSLSSKRSYGPKALCMALALSVLPVFADENSGPIPFLEIGRTYILNSSAPTLPTKVKILKSAGGGQWFLVEYAKRQKLVLLTTELKEPSTPKEPIIMQMWINFALISGVQLED